MFTSFVGWPLLFIQFFLVDQAEQLLAIQTIVCAVVNTYQPYHTATVVILFARLTQHHSHEWVNMLLHHIIIAAAVLLQYFSKKYSKVGWVCAAWSIYWLGYSSVYPLQSCLRCMVFIVVSNAQKRWAQSNNNCLKTVWILMVHELAWCAIPIQMLYEIYSEDNSKIIPV
jgi:general stress protein CsbA|tara:strand:+ start:8651 stop:9160 length:510 start_codon:yes stop_codon:yes gene_type:complete